MTAILVAALLFLVEDDRSFRNFLVLLRFLLLLKRCFTLRLFVGIDCRNCRKADQRHGRSTFALEGAIARFCDGIIVLSIQAGKLRMDGQTYGATPAFG